VTTGHGSEFLRKLRKLESRHKTFGEMKWNLSFAAQCQNYSYISIIIYLPAGKPLMYCTTYNEGLPMVSLFNFSV